MPFQPENPSDVRRLRNSIERSRTETQKFRNNRKVLLDALSDPCHEFADIPTEMRKPLNPMRRMFNIFTRGVVDQNPTLRITRTKQPRTAGMLKEKLQRWAQDSRLSETLQGVFHEALLRWGWGYINYDVGKQGIEIYLDCLDFDDCFIDMRGSDEHDIDFEGHDFGRRLYELQDNPKFNQAAVSEMATRYAKDSDLDPIYKWCELRCVYLPKEKLILTLSKDAQGDDPPLRIQEYVGPPTGPYPKLNLGRTRSRMVPVSIASDLYDLADFVVRSVRHVFVQADRQVEFFTYNGESKKDADRHRLALDGEYFQMENPASVTRNVKGGVNPQTLATGIWADDKFDTEAGNLKLAGGLGPSADTAHQESMLGGGVQAMFDDAKQKMTKFTTQVYDTVAWYMARDPIRGNESVGNPPEMVEWTDSRGIRAASKWIPGVGETMVPGDPTMEIIPGSMVSRSAEQQLAALNGSIQRIAQTMALPGEAPAVFKHSRYRDLEAELGNMPEIGELFGEAPSPAAVVPGADAGGQFGQQQGRPQGGMKPQGQNPAVDRMLYSGGQAQQQPA